MQERLPASISVLEAHAKDAKEHFELARSLFKKVKLCRCHEAAEWDLQDSILSWPGSHC